ncbi:MAG: mechanosensitive ion channel [Chitinophagaceae bacterium]|jgi:MscS family membrane protein|nr:mechanosensitive ion channel [Chitinophagaceae bacterium]MBK7678435.1 mechanosensitive ion channel [Chitinophagaceae bacterium]MBK9464250.1 mechanosensitive ion channel [Chitinophagaceae bacterium]MBK9939050.1 mechanosensitive ion channel [Chitinophagaceae bacterium]MBL0067081.1 mechanosensitive ion channel [Chitinophagaceae bacterium]
MNDFLNQVWWGNPVKNYLLIIGIIFFVWVLKRFISRYIAGLLYGLVHKIWRNIEKKSFINLVVKPLGLFLAVLVSIIALYKLKFPEEIDVDVYKFTAKDIFHSGGNIILIVTFTGLLLRIIDFVALILERRANFTPDLSDNQLIVFFKDFFKAILVIIGIMLVLRYAFSLNIGGLLTGLSIVGAAIALSLRESLENLIASFIIFFDKPFITGDLVKVLNITGTVERIGLRSTRIRTDQTTFVTVPNKQMVDSVLDNLSLRTQRRGDLRLEINLQTSSATIELLIGGLKKIMDRKEVENVNIIFSEITGNAFIIISDYYTAPVTLQEFNDVKQTINLQSLKLMEELKIEIAGANMDVRIIQ